MSAHNLHPRPYHRDSIYGPGPRKPLCRERRAVWKARLKLFRLARKITPAHEDIGLVLLKRLGIDGQLDPSHQTIAEHSGYDERTVRRALDRFKACGLVMWTQRIVRVGWRALQTSNAYMLTIASTPPPLRAIRTGGLSDRETRKQDIYIPTASAQEVAEAREALARRAALVQQRLLNKVK